MRYFSPFGFLVRSFLLAEVALSYLTFVQPEQATAEPFSYESPEGNSAIWPKLPVKLCTSAEVPRKIQKALWEAMQIWNASFSFRIFEPGCVLKGQQKYKPADTATHGVYWVRKKFDSFTEKTALARTLTSFTDDGTFLDADILLNGEFYDWEKTKIDPTTVLVHELGHTLGLKHFFLSLDSAVNYYPYVGGYQFRKIGRYETEAVQWLKQYLEKNPQSAFGFVTLGTWYLDSDQSELAKAAFEKTLELYPNSNEALVSLGLIYKEKKNLSLAKNYLKMSLKVLPTNWAACALLFDLTKLKKYQTCQRKYQPSPSPSP